MIFSLKTASFRALLVMLLFHVPSIDAKPHPMSLCIGGSAYSYVCPPGQKFDRDEEECRPAQNVNCPEHYPHTKKCRNQTDGFYPDYSDACRSYYRCSDDEVVGSGRCDGGALWDFATASCGSGMGASCSPPSCWGLPDGHHPVEGSGCTAYFTCKRGIRTDNVCPSGTIFDYMDKACVSNSRSVCYERVCEGRQNGIHAMPRSPCHAYFRCFNAALVQVEVCPPLYIFDGWECVQAANFSCWSESNGSCAERPDGVYAGDDKECRGFFLCRQKRLVRSFRCSPGLVFNGEKCVDSQNYICSSRPKVPDCSNKLNGYYATDKSNCRSFYYCRDGTKLSDHNCPGNYVFNGEQCVDPQHFSC
ncbi:Chitin binding domain [Trinorchestia longiramus]|nr:Chitin binding domain [Trinorchestia longiramus]